jgi:hypothetical protein
MATRLNGDGSHNYHMNPYLDWAADIRCLFLLEKLNAVHEVRSARQRERIKAIYRGKPKWRISELQARQIVSLL